MDRIEPELVLKTTPPRSPKTAQVRERLSIGGPELSDKVAIAVHAPAGFGKTFLLTQWRREFLSRGAVVAWLTLDSHDDGPRFVQGLMAAMAIGSGRQSFAGSFERMPGRDELEGLTGWLAEVADLGSETILMLDEADALPEVTVRQSLAYLLHNAPANLRIIMASRSRLSLQVADLLARGLYVAIAADLLRFRTEETVTILSNRFGARIDPDLCVRLQEITEGWPLGLQLAIAAIEKSPNLGAAVEQLSACSGDIQRYFVDSLVVRLPVEQVDFLTCIALLEMVNPSLCIALTHNERAGETLLELCGSTPIFVESVNSEWVRIHPLAREFLLGRFSDLSLMQRQTFHERAAIWLEEHALFEEAARQYLLAGHTTQTYEMVEQCLYEIMLRGQFSRVLEWVEKLPAQEVESRPRMCLAAAWSLAMSDRHVEAAKLIAHLQQDPTADAETHCEAAAIAGAAAYFADRPDEILAIIGPWVEAPRSVSIKLQAIIANQIARLMLFQGHPEKARRIVQRAPHYDWTPGLDAIRGFGEWVVGMSYLSEGRILRAISALRNSLLCAEQDIGRRSPVAVALATSLATALLEHDEIQEAATVLANRLDIVERLASPDAIEMGFLTAARLAVLQSQPHRGEDLLDALFALGEDRGIVRFCLVALGEQIRMHALQGRVDTCQALWRRLDESVPDVAREQRGLLGPELGLVVGLAGAYVALVQRDWQTLLDALSNVNKTAESLRRGREIVQIKLLKALALRESGGDGLSCLLEAISLAEEYGLQRIVQDTHPELVKWSKMVTSETTRPAMQASLHAGPVVRPEPPPSSVSPSRLLTPKEREVLQLLARNLSNKQIAQALHVGEETVKWHLKNLFGKFQAGTRKHVVDRAYMLGILESAG
ncbi:LuxR C-terminal-related transcriptional regulator [Pseudomonas sp. YuFO20]|uniref:helix-turn-helix transcriptional regulator n=1 Tax=Pseudomonas sp. YuFO20 TaxID=3095362 RepID=UPI002B24D508|nr:LuxR C-terminal-related transcriptional regulator [Pseudomonas sp. YuFO20]MEB2514082.1 LuxR C-terminal-related transcriptional regulator [Pseudomonas sp. YuFO20]